MLWRILHADVHAQYDRFVSKYDALSHEDANSSFFSGAHAGDKVDEVVLRSQQHVLSRSTWTPGSSCSERR